MAVSARSTSGFLSRHVRTGLLTSSAMLIAASVPTFASAQGRPTSADVTAYGSTLNPADLVTQPSIVISGPGTPTSAQDVAGGVNGVGQMTIDSGGGGLGICTGTLINPRTVIFAAHCVNANGAGTGAQNPWEYGSKGGGIPIAFGFATNNRPAVIDWFLPTTASGAVNTQQYKTNAANFLYNVNQVVYNADSLKLGLGLNFIQGDVAIATLDTPAANVPTWALLLSALPAPAAIGATTGTGYHVTITGYGRSGQGGTLVGDTNGIDFRRRIAENTIGILGSFDDRDAFLFGSTSGLPQNLYQLDFDDPRRGTAAASPYDFNLFKDDALPKEGTTAGGDSGGPLILDRTFAKQVVIGVLSGGSRFFGATPFGAYGTESFYQPLYLFSDYIAANNPYRYAQTKAGDGAWTDASHWVTALDPNYQIIVDGKLVNGVPTTTGAGIAGDGNKFGQVCFQTDCVDVKTGVETIDGVPVTTTGATPAVVTKIATGGVAGRGMMLETAAQGGKADASLLAGAESVAQAGTDAVALAVLSPTLANGLPGATNFIPNNIDPDRTIQRSARYYDVSLTAAGTTTLGSAVTVDKFTVAGGTARLAVTAAGSLTSLMTINQMTGTVQNDGMITTPGDYFMMTGLLTGSGRITTPFFTSVSGMIAPGTMGTTGTLTIAGNGILASGTNLLVDLGPNGTSDRLAFAATTFNASGAATNGIVNLGGSVGFAPVTGQTIRYNDLYTIVTAQGGISGAFNAATPLSAILTPSYVYSTNAVQVRILAGQYRSVVAATPVQGAYAQLLDQNRSNYTSLSGLYGTLDLQNAATIRSTLEGLAPRAETLKTSLGIASIDTMSRFYRDHLAQVDTRGGLGGTLALIGKPVQLASLMATDRPGGQDMMSDSSGTMVQQGRLPDDMSGFLAGGYIDGKSRSMPGANPFGGHDRFDGYFIAGGLEKQAGEAAVIGFSFAYTNTDGTTGGVAQRAEGELYQGTLYGKLETASGIVLDSQFSAGAFVTRTDRTVGVVGTNARLRSSDSALTVISEVGLGKAFDLSSLKVGPRVSLRASHIGFEKSLERGEAPALFFDRDSFDSVQGRAGLTLSGGGSVRPYAAANYVHDFQSTPGYFGANFVGGIGPNALFALARQDKNWGEVSAGLTLVGDRVDLSIGADTTVERKDVSNQSYKGSVKIRF
ncbi:transporter [Sphingomonas sp. Leaf34]|uniref:autotransporter outer membrane beta-barrel domain-containing protein n=1 Tax=Sphingomonas sp. Leaf34 TaxID=1736216 RepID=UPI0006F759DB|nr:autotransporter outer membrane beta-barrel domain-containing protein [Sphingomonas sp. Leaf34]KQN31323.1 transporter [Sphingomonas sp. Leaf34]